MTFSPTDSSTATVTSARDDARARGTLTADFMPYLPASSSPFAPEGIAPADLVWAETVAPGGYAERGSCSRIRRAMPALTWWSSTPSSRGSD